MKILPQVIYKLHNLFWRITKPLTLGVRLVLEKDQRIVLVKHTYHRHWYLPGGGVKKGENFEVCNDFELIAHRDYEIECIESFPLDGLPKDTSAGTLRRIREYQRRDDLPIVGMW